MWGDKTFEQALNNAANAGLKAVEIGTGGYPGSQHCPVDDLLESKGRRDDYLGAIHSRDLILSALSIHNNPLHPNPDVRQQADEEIRKTIHLAQLLEVPVVNGFSGLPGGSAQDTMPNWVTCAWPPHFLDILKYQWDEITIPYWQEMNRFLDDHGVNFGFEMHPGILVYNVYSLLRLRDAAGNRLGCNFDPSHLWWNGVDPISAIRELNDAIFHVHGKDVYIDRHNTQVNGCNDYKPYDQIAERSWTFRSIGYGHSLDTWREIMSTLRLVGYDYVISIEHEDALMSADEGLRKAISTLKDAVMEEPPGEMFWA